jgi:hypothetical protein
MRVPLLLLSFCAAALAADAGDPAGTVALRLGVGETAPLHGPPGSNVLCDNLSVVSPEFTDDADGGGVAFVLRALKPGTTLCGLWLPLQTPGGLYRVHVSPAAGTADGGVQDAAMPDAR